MAEKMTDVNRMIRELEEADIDDDGVCVRYFPYKSDVPILVNALKMYRGFMTENKMEQVAAIFGKKLGEEFWIQGFCGVYKVKFTEGGILYLDTDEPNYRWRLHNIDPLLIGNAEILSSDDWRVKQTLKDLARR